jgi:acyl dehydratase
MSETWTIDEFRSRVGQEVGVSDWFLVEEETIRGFADLTQDWAFVHVDAERARQAGLPGIIAHGFLTMAFIATLVPTGLPRMKDVTVGFNYGFNRLRLVAPVPAGKRIRGRFALKEYVERVPGEWLLTFGVTIEIEGEERPALVAEWLILYRIG